MHIDRSTGATPIVMEDDGDHSNVDISDEDDDNPIVTHPPLHLSSPFLAGGKYSGICGFGATRAVLS